MSESYPQYPLTNFPESADNFTLMQDINLSDIALATQYKNYINSGNITEANNLLIANPSLNSKILSSTNINKLLSAVNVIELFFISNVQGFISEKQTELNTKLSQFSNQGSYNSAVTYLQWNTVTLNGRTYLSKQDNNLNHTPVGNISDSWWYLIAEKGDTGDTGYGVGLQFRNQFVISTQYHVDDLVVYNGNLYRCKVDSLNHYPTDENYWEFFLSAYGENLNNLQTTDKSGLVPAINEIKNTSNATTLDGHDSTYFAVASTSVQTSDVVTIATANKILKLNNDSKLPASITGDANSINGHDSDYFDNKINTLAGTSGLNEKANKSALDTVETLLNNHKADNSHKYARYFLMMGGV